MSKERLTVTVDPELVAAGNAAVADGRVESLSAWVNRALRERAAKDQRLRALADAVATYEGRFGTITDEEIAIQERVDRASAVVVRGAKEPASRSTRGRRRGGL